MSATTTEASTVVGLRTLQFARGGLFDAEPTENEIHLVRATRLGTPGPCLCGRPRFPLDKGPGWSVGGGVMPVGWETRFRPCAGCARVSTAEFNGLPISGCFAKLFARTTP